MALIPSTIQAGDTLPLSASLSSYPASEYQLSITLVGPASRYVISYAADGENHVATISALDSSEYGAGKYTYHARVSKGDERYTVETGTTTVKPDVSTKQSFDARHHVEKVLEAIEAVLEGKATQDHLSVTFNGRAITRYAPEQLLKWRSVYKQELKSIQKAERLKQGLSSGNKIMVRF